MDSGVYPIEQKILFSESLIWQLNRNFYHDKGVTAWSEDIVPHQVTNSSIAAKTYAELIFAFLKDLALEGSIDQVVYILELGAGHGKLCFNILKYLDSLIAQERNRLPEYCYVLSDIVEDNLLFFKDHPQFQEYYQRGVLDISYFDALESHTLNLRQSKKKISPSDLEQPILTIANYFFDSIPNELFHVKDNVLSVCSISINSSQNPEGKAAQKLIEEMELTYHKSVVTGSYFEEDYLNTILLPYRKITKESYILFPKIAMTCLSKIKALSKQGMVLLSMDKGYYNMEGLAGRTRPDLVKHGSFSFWVNFHAIGQCCINEGGKALFGTSASFSVEVGCLLFSNDTAKYYLLQQAYQKYTSQSNLDDFNSIKKLAYTNKSDIKLTEVLALLRMSGYDSNIFIKLLPRLKQLTKTITHNERTRLGHTIALIWNRYFRIKEQYDLSYELGGIMYDLGYYAEALIYFDHSQDRFGSKADVCYNQILCYYQLRQDHLFYESLKEAKLLFPESEIFIRLDQLNMDN